MASILVIEDEPDAAELLAINLRHAGHEVSLVEDGGKGLKVAQTTRPELVITDHMLPTMNGMDICRALRADQATSAMPIILLTARAAEADRVKGFECGADDYVTKPYSMKELMLRVQSLLRRRSPTPSADQQLKLGAITLDLLTQTASIHGEPLHLTSLEMKMLIMFARTPGQPVSRQQLLREVWGYSESTDTRTVDSHVRRLRQKLGDNAECIETVQGVGYRLVV